MLGIFAYVVVGEIETIKTIVEPDSFINVMSNVFTKSDNTFHILEKDFLSFLCNSQYSDYRHDTLLSPICN